MLQTREDLFSRPIAKGADGTQQFQLSTDHLNNTAKLCEKYCEIPRLKILAYFIGLSHDLGKSNSDWQSFLKESVQGTGQRKGKDHSSAGGLLLQEADTIPDMWRELAANVCWCHHGLVDMYQENRGVWQSLSERKKEKFSEINANKALLEEVKKEFEQFSPLELGRFFPPQEKNWLNDERGFYTAMYWRYLLSILIDADWTDSAMSSQLTPVSLDLFVPDWEKISLEFENRYQEKVLDGTPDTPLNKVRKKISQQCFEKGSSKQMFFRLNVPTGGGKTLSSMRFALQKAKQMKAAHIFYAAPYNSILDQNAKDYQGYFNPEDVLVHHSGADWITVCDADAETDYSREQIEAAKKSAQFAENWQGVPIVLVSCAKIIDSLFSSKKTILRRFHSLANSVLVFDEVQDIPVQWTYAFTEAVNFLMEQLNCCVVFCSATQPLFHLTTDHQLRVPRNAEMVSLSEEDKKLFRRTRIDWITKPGRNRLLPVDQSVVVRHVAENLNMDIDSAMVVTNLKSTAKKLHFSFVSEVGDVIDCINLSNDKCPHEVMDTIAYVKNRLHEIRECKKAGKPYRKLLLTTTKIVQAGINFSFGAVYRSAAGLDDLIQCDGRNNREGEEETATTYLVKLEGDDVCKLNNGKIMAKHLDSIIMKYSISEIMTAPAVEEYYRRLNVSYSENIRTNTISSRNECIYAGRDINCGTSSISFLSEFSEPPLRAVFEKKGIQEEFPLYGSFKTIERENRADYIEKATISLVVKAEVIRESKCIKATDILNSLENADKDEDKRRLLKQLHSFMIQVYPNQFNLLKGMIEYPLSDFRELPVLKSEFYDSGVRGVGLNFSATST